MSMIETVPPVAGKIIEGAPLSSFTWFRVGGPADILFLPKDEADLSQFLKHLPLDVPVLPVGVGSNLLVRDGGIRGVVIRLSAAFAKIEIDGMRVRAGAAALDANVAKKAARANIAGLEFLRGIPGTIGGALRMNAGAYGCETKERLIEAVAYDRAGKRHCFSVDELDYGYRHCGLGAEYIFTEALLEGEMGEAANIEMRMAEIMNKRESTQPIREKTGGSTFKNPDPEISGGRGAWQLIDAAGGRGFQVGDAMFSEQHCNFMINKGHASAEDLERLGETVRAMVKEKTGVSLTWEIKRIGEAQDE